MDEVIYVHTPARSRYENFAKLTVEELKDIDNLARLMQKPDENFSKLQNIWNTNKEFRLLSGGLL